MSASSNGAPRLHALPVAGSSANEQPRNGYQANADERPLANPSDRAADAERGHVLIVEDDLIIADLIDQILRFESFNVSHVIDGRSAVDYARTHLPDLILMDLMLPVMSGMEASREIKADPDDQVSQIPIVAMSAGVNLRATAHGLAVEGVLAKPFDIDELLATVDIHIRRNEES
jgi:DNA-binding response OmpR family regulator